MNNVQLKNKGGTLYFASSQESIEEERLEKYSALQNVKQLKTELEGLKEQAAKKPVQKTEVCT